MRVRDEGHAMKDGERSMESNGFVTYAGVVHPWMCDVMGHLNTRNYVGMFDDASFQLLGRIGGPDFDRSVQGWADLQLEVHYLHETRAGELVTIQSHVEKVGGSSLVYRHVMTGTLTGTVHATARIVS